MNVRVIVLALAALVSETGLARAQDAFAEYRQGLVLARAGQVAEALALWRPLLSPARRGELSSKQLATVATACARASRSLGNAANAQRFEAFAREVAGGGLDESFESLESALLSERLAPGSQREAFAKLVPVFRTAASAPGAAPRVRYALGTCLLHTEADSVEAERLLVESAKDESLASEAAEQVAALCARRSDVGGQVAWLRRVVAGGKARSDVLVTLASALGARNADGDADEVVELTRQAVADDASLGRAVLDAITDQGLRGRLEPLVAEAERQVAAERAEEERLDEQRRQQRQGEVDAYTSATKPKPTPVAPIRRVIPGSGG